MCTIVAYAGRFSFTVVRDLFESGGILGGVTSVVLLALIMLAMIRIDWTRFIDRKPEEKEG